MALLVRAPAGVGRSYALGYLGLVHGDMGEFDRSFVYLEEALTLVRQGRSRALEGSILTQMAMVQLWQGDWQACLATSAMMQRTAERVHGPYILAMSKTVSGYASFMLRPGDEGIEALTEAVAWLESTQIGLTMSWNRACLAEVLALSSRREEATAQASKALERLSAKDRLGEAAAHRALGIAAGIAGSWADAAPHFERSLVVAEQKNSPRDAAITRFRGAEVALRANADAGDRSSRAGEELADERDHGLRQDEHAVVRSPSPRGSRREVGSTAPDRRVRFARSVAIARRHRGSDRRAP